MITFERDYDDYKHWSLDIADEKATLYLDVAEKEGIKPGYELKLNSYDLGVDIELNDIILAGQLLGEKTVINEFIAYLSLKDIVANNMGNVLIQKRTVVILTYALCGFSNFASIGIQIGGIGSIAPNQRSTLARLGLRSLIGGTLACLMTATIAGIFN